MSTSCASKLYSSTPPLNYPKVADTKSWIVAAIRSESTEIATAVSVTEVEASKKLEQKLNLLKAKFHEERKLLVKHLPRNVKEQEIAELLVDFSIDCIQLTNNDDKSSTATVTLENPRIFDEWDGDRTFFLREQTVSVTPTPTEMVLCVARLPFHFTEDDFRNLVDEYGEVKMSFLMISEQTGSSKGYGFVRYANKESALLARHALNDKCIDTFQLVCDWLDSSHLTFSSLHSKCLYVDNLPKQFRDMGEFRAIFERIVKPPYCQIALKKGCPLDWGLVEYLSPEDAELAQTSCHYYCLMNQPIRVVYFIPGIRAINLMLSLLDTSSRGGAGGSSGKAGGLLPDPTGQSIRMSIENLSKQNPIFAENLKNIILHQIQESKHNMKESRDEAKVFADSKNVDGSGGGSVAIQKPLHAEVEKMVPPTPPMTPTVVNGIPIISSSIPPSVPLIPNTAIPPPPVVEKLSAAYNQQQPLSINFTDKYPFMWSDLIGPSISSGSGGSVAYPSILSTLTPPDPATVSFASVTPTPIPTNLLHEVVNLPLNIRQNIVNLINNPPHISTQGQPPSASISHAVGGPVVAQGAPPPPLPPALQSPSVHYSPLTVNQIRIFQNAQEALVTPQTPQHMLTVPFAAKPIIPPPPPPPSQNAWPSVSISPFMTPATAHIPVFPTSAAAAVAAADWHGLQMPAYTVISSQPSTPIMHHFAGQKRKLLPSPEKSPEGNYIGQHSQGIGGHYADSYFKKKKTY